MAFLLISKLDNLFSFTPFSAAPPAAVRFRRQGVHLLPGSSHPCDHMHCSRQFCLFKDGSGNALLIVLLLHIMMIGNTIFLSIVNSLIALCKRAVKFYFQLQTFYIYCLRSKWLRFYLQMITFYILNLRNNYFQIVPAKKQPDTTKHVYTCNNYA